jgi:hypothetical protein
VARVVGWEVGVTEEEEGERERAGEGRVVG